MPIEPDTKDWTWVVERPCPECGFNGAEVGADQVAELVRLNALAWHQILGGTHPAAALRARPSDDRWSVLEYACHVRDVYRLYDHRLHLMLDQDDPLYPNWDQDETAVTDHYNDQDPVVVLGDLQDAAETLAESFDDVEGETWQRTGTRSDGARFTVDTFGRYLVHDPIHHMHDVETNLARLTTQGGNRFGTTDSPKDDT